jgi:hypothetical protein
VSAASTQPQPFRSAENAWRWAFGILQSRQDGAGAPTGIGQGARPCEPDDIVTVIDRVFRAGRINLSHARVLRVYAERNTTPDPQSGDGRLWTHALRAIEPSLRAKGIVA